MNATDLDNWITTPPAIEAVDEDDHGPENCGDCPRCGVIE